MNNAFKEAVIPLMEFVEEYGHPYMTIIVTEAGAELLEGHVAVPASGEARIREEKVEPKEEDGREMQEEKISTKPDGFTEFEKRFMDNLAVPQELADELIEVIKEVDPDFAFAEDDSRVYDLNKFSRCTCEGEFEPDKNSGMCGICYGAHPEADFMFFHKDGVGFAGIETKFKV